MRTTIDSVGRLVIPKQLREALGLESGSSVDISLYGEGLQILPVSRTARLVRVDGQLVAESDTLITDETVFGLLDAGRR